MQYTKSHEWVQVTDSIATVGVSDFAQDELGDIVYIELPDVGTEVSAGKEVVVLESTKAAADVYAPISGVIEEVNTELGNNPGLINESPESKGWLIKIKIKDREELKSLMNRTVYQEFIQNK